MELWNDVLLLFFVLFTFAHAVPLHCGPSCLDSVHAEDEQPVDVGDNDQRDTEQLLENAKWVASYEYGFDAFTFMHIDMLLGLSKWFDFNAKWPFIVASPTLTLSMAPGLHTRPFRAHFAKASSSFTETLDEHAPAWVPVPVSTFRCQDPPGCTTFTLHLGELDPGWAEAQVARYYLYLKSTENDRAPFVIVFEIMVDLFGFYSNGLLPPRPVIPHIPQWCSAANFLQSFTQDNNLIPFSQLSPRKGKVPKWTITNASTMVFEPRLKPNISHFSFFARVFYYSGDTKDAYRPKKSPLYECHEPSCLTYIIESNTIQALLQGKNRVNSVLFIRFSLSVGIEQANWYTRLQPILSDELVVYSTSSVNPIFQPISINGKTLHREYFEPEKKILDLEYATPRLSIRFQSGQTLRPRLLPSQGPVIIEITLSTLDQGRFETQHFYLSDKHHKDGTLVVYLSELDSPVMKTCESLHERVLVLTITMLQKQKTPRITKEKIQLRFNVPHYMKHESCQLPSKQLSRGLNSASKSGYISLVSRENWLKEDLYEELKSKLAEGYGTLNEELLVLKSMISDSQINSISQWSTSEDLRFFCSKFIKKRVRFYSNVSHEVEEKNNQDILSLLSQLCGYELNPLPLDIIDDTSYRNNYMTKKGKQQNFKPQVSTGFKIASVGANKTIHEEVHPMKLEIEQEASDHFDEDVDLPEAHSLTLGEGLKEMVGKLLWYFFNYSHSDKF